MLIIISQVGLADTAQSAVAIDLRQYSYFQSPITGNPVSPGQVGFHSKFSGQRITKTVQINQKAVIVQHLHQTSNKRCDKKAGHSSVKSVGDPAVISLAELIIKPGTNYGKTEAGQHFRIITEDIAIVEGNHLAFSGGQNIAVGHPGGQSLALVKTAAFFFQRLINGFQPRAVIPYDDFFLREFGEKPLGELKLLATGTAHGNDDLFQVGDGFKGLDDFRQGLALQL